MHLSFTAVCHKTTRRSVRTTTASLRTADQARARRSRPHADGEGGIGLALAREQERECACERASHLCAVDENVASGFWDTVHPTLSYETNTTITIIIHR